MEPSELLRYVVGVLDRIGADYLVTGSMVTIAFGEPRYTNDIDIVVDLQSQQIPAFCEAFPAPEYYVSEDAVRQSVANRGPFNVIQPSTGLKVDFFVRKNSPFDDERFARRHRVASSGGFDVCYASLEDVIIKKMDYYREGGSEKHLRDICGMLRVSGDRIDSDYIEGWAGKMHLQTVWNAILARMQADEQQ